MRGSRMGTATKKTICLVISVILVTVILAAICLNADAIKTGGGPVNGAVQPTAQSGQLTHDDGGNLIFGQELSQLGYIYAQDGTRLEGDYKSARFDASELDFQNKEYRINSGCHVTFWNSSGEFSGGYEIKNATSEDPAQVYGVAVQYDYILIGLLYPDARMYGLDKGAMKVDFQKKFKDSLPNLYRLTDTAVDASLIDSYQPSPYGNLLDRRTISEGAALLQNAAEKMGEEFNESAYIAIEPQTEYMLNFSSYITFYDKDKNFISGYQEEQAAVSHPKALKNIPQNAQFARLSVNKDDLDQAVLARSDCYAENLPALYMLGPVGDSGTYLAQKDTNPLYGKTAVFFGDSLCHGNGDAAGGWASWIQEKNPSMNCINCGVGGHTFLMGSDKWFDGGQNQQSLPDDADYIIIEGYTNGMYTKKPKKPLGTINEDDYTVTVENCDTSTYSGEMEKLVLQCIERWNGKKLGFIISYKAAAHLSSSNPYRQFTKQMLACCRKYSIPVLNLQEESTIPSYTQAYIDEYFYKKNGALHGDGIHLNAKGNAIISAKIEAWMKTL